jgi:hypothetical protein
LAETKAEHLNDSRVLSSEQVKELIDKNAIAIQEYFDFKLRVIYLE